MYFTPESLRGIAVAHFVQKLHHTPNHIEPHQIARGEDAICLVEQFLPAISSHPEGPEERQHEKDQSVATEDKLPHEAGLIQEAIGIP